MTDVNLAPITSSLWSIGGSSWSQEFDYSVYHSISPSMRIGPHNSLNPYREIDGFLPNTFSPGDRLVWYMWVKAGNSTLGQNGVKNNGPILNWDWYNAIGRLHDHSSNDPSYDQNNNSAQAIGASIGIPFNTDWTLLISDCIVPAHVLNQQYPSHGAQYEVPNSLVLNPLVSWYNPATGDQIDDGLAWFSDPEFYINPSGTTPVKKTLNISVITL